MYMVINDMLKIYGDVNSGNCYKIKLLAEQLQLDYQWRNVDIMAGESHTAEFLSKNPNGKIPLVAFPDGRVLAESNAILFHLAEGSDFLPDDRWQRAQMLQWLFFEQYSHEPNIATSRYIIRYLGNPESHQQKLAERQAPGYKALNVMEDHLCQQDYFAGTQYSIADIALYAYTHVAEEGGFLLAELPAIQQWLARVAAQPNYVSMG